MEKKKIRKRVDQLLVERGLADNLKEAQSYIMADQVRTSDRKILKPSELLTSGDEIKVIGQKQFVSRAAGKLLSFLESNNLVQAIKDQTCVDIGASTGGFTQVLLNLGAKKVFAIDVGTNQLAWKLRNDERVECLENTDIRSVTKLPENPVVLVADLSFVSTASIVSHILEIFSDSVEHYFILVKPQFELEKERVPDGGIVVDNDLRREALEKVIDAFSTAGNFSFVSSDSKIHGRHGNIEIMLHVSPS